MGAVETGALFYAVQKELARQVTLGFDAAHDAGHTNAEWLSLLRLYVERLERAVAVGDQTDVSAIRDALIKTAAVLFAWNNATGWIGRDYLDYPAEYDQETR